MSKVEANNKPARSAIGSIGKYGIPSGNGVYELLECLVCTNLMYPPIYQCPNGHTLCSSCKLRVHNTCPTCRYELGNIRCLALEKVAESLEVPCRYQTLGCHDILPYYSKLKHEQHCRFRSYDCPYAGSECSVTFQLLLTISEMIIKSICMMVAPSTTVMSSRILMRLRMLHGCLRCSTDLKDSSAYTLRRFSSGWHQCTWRFYGSWETRRRLRSLVTAWKLGRTAVD